MTKIELINEMNSFEYMLETNNIVDNVIFDESDGMRRIWVFFKNQKYPCFTSTKIADDSHTLPLFNIGVVESEKYDEIIEIRKKICQWLFCRFWIWLKKIDKLYDNLVVNGNVTFSDNEFFDLIDMGWCIQYYELKEKFELCYKPNEMFLFYNNDIDDDLYNCNLMKIKYINHEFIFLSDKRTKDVSNEIIKF